MRIALFLLLASASPAIAQDRPADPLRALTGGVWVLEPDEPYEKRVEDRPFYQPSPARSGFRAHGSLDNIQSVSGIGFSQGETCVRERLAAIDASGSRVGTEYWYVQAGSEALVLVRTRRAVAAADCTVTFAFEGAVHRLIVGESGFTRFARRADGSYAADTRTVGRDDDPRIGATYDAVTFLAMRKRSTEEGAVSRPIGALQTRCITVSSPPDSGGQQCWIASKGAARGLIIYDLFLSAGSPEVGQSLDTVELDARIDGRLFEWGRDIRLSPDISRGNK